MLRPDVSLNSDDLTLADSIHRLITLDRATGTLEILKP